MLVDLSQEEFRRLLALFEEAGYVEATIRKHLGAAELPSRQLRNESRLLDRTGGERRTRIRDRYRRLPALYRPYPGTGRPAAARQRQPGRD